MFLSDPAGPGGCQRVFGTMVFLRILNVWVLDEVAAFARVEQWDRDYSVAGHVTLERVVEVSLDERPLRWIAEDVFCAADPDLYRRDRSVRDLHHVVRGGLKWGIPGRPD